MSRLFSLLLGATLLWPLGVAAQPAASVDALPELRGVWVHEVSLGSPAAVDATMRQIAEAGFNLAYVRTWFQGVTLYPSDVVEAAGGPRQHRTFVGRDPLREAIDAGKRYDVEVGAWMEYGLVAHTGYAQGLTCNDPGPILTANPDWSMQNRSGQIAEPPSVANGLCFYWMDPAHPGVLAFLRDLATEIGARYPDLAVYEGDRFRYPSLDWSFAPATVARYRAETGLRDPATLPAGDPELAAWRDWRRARTADVMRASFEAAKAANPNLVVSAAVVPPYMIDSAQDKLQHWPSWAAEGIIDVVEPMLYLPDSDFPNQLGLALGRMPAAGPSRPLFAAGIDARDDDARYRAPAQVAEARRRGTDGVVFWCWDRCSMAGWLPALRDDVFAAPATLPYNDRIGAAGAAQRTGPWQARQGGFSDFHYALAPGTAGEATWTLRALRGGYYDVFVRSPGGEDLAPDAALALEAGTVTGEWTVDQRGAAGWRFAGQVYLAGPAEATLRLRAGSAGTAAADAVRLLRSAPFRADAALAVAPDVLEVRFNYAPDPARVAPARFTLDGATVVSAAVSPSDPHVVLIGTSALTAGVPYTLGAEGLADVLGRALLPGTLVFTYDPAGLVRAVQPGEAAFVLNGTWATVGDGEAPGGMLRTAAGAQAANRARWNVTLPATGLYEISAWLPSGTPARTPAAAYQVAHSGRFETVVLDQQAAHHGWNSLGVFPYEAGATGLVQLLGGASAAGEMVAGALRWRRTLSTVDAEAGPDGTPLIGRPYPNPTRGMLRLPLGDLAPGTVRVEVLDVLGRAVHRGREQRALWDGSAPCLQIDLSHVPPGVYFLRVQPERGPVQTRRVTVMR